MIRSRLWRLAAEIPMPNWLSLSWPTRLAERWLTHNYELQRKALTYVPANTLFLLDIGCGGAAYLDKCTVPIIVGLDCNTKRLKIASKHCSITKIHDLAQPLPRDIPADCAICLEVIEHLWRHQGQALLEHLSTYPTAVLSTPRAYFRVRRNSCEAHRSYWSPEELQSLGWTLAHEMQTPPSNIYVRYR